MDTKVEGMLIPIVEYEVYDSIKGENLNLNLCEDKNINLFVHAEIDKEKLYLYNQSSEYYTDPCKSYTTENGTDKTIVDRKSDFGNNNYSLCEINCTLEDYDLLSEMAKCNCKANPVRINLQEMQLNKSLLFNNFVDLKNSTNFFVVKCYKYLFKKDGISLNMGSYILLVIILIYFICLLFFLIFGYKSLLFNINLFKRDNIIKENNMKKVCFEKSDNQKFKRTKTNVIRQNSETKNINIYLNNFSKIINRSKTNKIQKSDVKVIKSHKRKSKGEPPKIKRELSILTTCKSKDGLKRSSTFKIKNKKMIQPKIIDPKIDTLENKTLQTKSDVDNNKINTNYLKYHYNDYEVNNLNYEDAILKDNRNYWQYYFSLLRTNHLVIFTFYTKDYNPRVIKILLFFFKFSLFFTVNDFFFNDVSMRKIYADHGKYNFIYQLPQIVYSFLITRVVNIIIKTLSLPQKILLSIKLHTNDNKEPIEKKIKCLKIKFVTFFTLTFILLTLFWYYISCFCIVYKNTQKFLIKDTLISFSLAFIYPVFSCLIPGLMRIPSIKAKRKDKSCLYKFSVLMQLI